MSDIAIIGAGPYGLSIAAHLLRRGHRLRIFGPPLQTWREKMPTGMHLKSEGFASTLYDPDGTFPLSRFCAENDIAYAPTGLPVALEIFSAYGQEFQKRFVPMLDPTMVTQVERHKGGFAVHLATGEVASFQRVICAIGITHYAYLPPDLAEFPASVVSHSSTYGDLTQFAGRRVAVIGGGASAADCAALLAHSGATTHLLTRRAQLAFHAPPRRRSAAERLRRPTTTIGPGWRSVFCVRGPQLFHVMPEKFRLTVTRRHLGPAPCWFVRDTVQNRVAVHPSTRLTGVAVQNGQAQLSLASPNGAADLAVDHVIAATGYRVDLARLAFLGPALRPEIRVAANTPVLSNNFESSVPGLYFVGATAANAFGPLVRFACGAQFTSRRLSRHFGAA